MEGKLSLGKVIAIVKASLNSAQLTGTPTAPTAEPGTNTDQVATTAFVNTAIEGAIEDAIAGEY